MTVGPAAEFIVEDTSAQVLASSTAFTDFTPTLNMYGSAFSTRTGRYSQTVSNDPTVYKLTDFTNTTTHIDVVLGSADETCFTVSANPNPPAPPPCQPVAQSPAWAGGLDGYWGTDNSQHVNYVAANGHIHEMYIHPGAPWVNNDLTAFTSGALAVANSGLDGYWGSDNSKHVNFIARDGHVNELYIHPGANWVDNDLTAFTRGTTAASGSALDAYWGSDNSQHVNFVAADGHIHELYIRPGAGWADNDLTAFSRGLPAAAGSRLDGYWGSDSSQHVNFITRDGHVHELYIHPGAGWVDNDLTIFSHGTLAAAGSKLDGYWGSDNSQHVNFVAADGHIHELYIRPGAGWVDNDLIGFTEGAPAITGSALDGYWGSDSSQHVNYIDADGHVHELYIHPGVFWVDNDLTVM
jgi:predicted NUDIX family NTP pyrophosphohydrolase